MKYSDIVTRTRQLLRDSGASSARYDDSMIMSGILFAVQRLNMLQPTSRYIAGHLHDVVYSLAKEDDVPKELQHWAEGIAMIAVSFCIDTDVADSVNLQLSQTFLQKGMQIFQS